MMTKAWVWWSHYKVQVMGVCEYKFKAQVLSQSTIVFWCMAMHVIEFYGVGQMWPLCFEPFMKVESKDLLPTSREHEDGLTANVQSRESRRA